MLKKQLFGQEANLILSWVRDAAIHAADGLFSQPLDWPFILSHACYHELSGLMYRSLYSAGLLDKIPSRALSQLKYIYNSTLFKNLELWKEFCSIHDAFKGIGVRAIPIKGVILSEVLYNDFGSRPMVDIDILIRKNDMSKAEGALLTVGYKKNTGRYSQGYFEEHSCQIPFLKKYPDSRMVSCEVHWDIAMPRPNKIILSDLWRRVEERNIDGRDILMLSPEDTFFSLALHLRRYNRPLSLKYIVDVTRLIESHKGMFDWDYVLNESKKNRMKSTVYFALFCASKLLRVSVPGRVLEKTRPWLLRDTIMQYIISRYTFSKGLTRRSGRNAYLYVLLRYLLYDRAWDFISFVFFIPIEEFARFYSLPFPSRKTSMLYRWRYIYIPFRIFVSLFTKL